jgi:serpin B
VTAVAIGGCGTGVPSASPSVSPLPPSTTPAMSPSAEPSPSSAALAIELVRSQLARAGAEDGDARAAAEAINAFALDLHRALAADGENLVVSPASIAIALGMARAGARGETADQMDAVLREVASDEHGGWLNSLDQALAARSGTFRDAEQTEHELTLTIASTYFAQRGMTFEAGFLDALATRFDSGMRVVDFVADPEAVRHLINAWVNEQTRERIPSILQPGDIVSATRLALVNAIYLKAPWYQAFRLDQTSDAPFTLGDGTTIPVPTMHTGGQLACATGDGWAATDLRYIDQKLSMLIVVPQDLAAFEAGLGPSQFAAVLEALADSEEAYTAVAEVSLPRFEIESRASLGDVLAALGMPNAFDPALADFSGMTLEESLYIGKVIHQANISVDEKGTEAAAATVVSMDVGGGPSDTCTVNANRPFLFALRDRETGAVLFMGRVVDPAG